MSTAQMTPRKRLYIGSTAKGVRTTKDAVNRFLDLPGTPATPLGEVDDLHWIYKQFMGLDNVTALKRVKPSTFNKTENYFDIGKFETIKGQKADVNQINLRFFDRVDEDYPILEEACRERKISVPRVQVGINTIDLLVFALRDKADEQLNSFIEATRREMAAIWKRTGGNAFFLIETPSATIAANATKGNKKILNWYANAIVKLVRALPKGAGYGFHFCTGRLGDRAVGDHGVLRLLHARTVMYNPKYTVKLILCVLAALRDAGCRLPELVHIPMALGSRPPSSRGRHYRAYAALRNIDPAIDVYAGAISAKQSLRRQKKLYAMLDKIFGRIVGVATTCGFGSGDRRIMNACMHRMAHI